MNLDQIKAKIAKLLRLQQSSNAHEAANAAAFVEKLCREYGILPESVSQDADQEGEVLQFVTLSGKRIDRAKQTLMGALVKYYNGKIIISKKNGPSEWNVFATEGAKIQIEIYFDYLVEQMKDFADGAALIALAKGQFVDNKFKKDFCYGFAYGVYERLMEMKQEREQQGDGNTPGLAVIDRNTRQMRKAEEASRLAFPRQTRHRAAGYRGGNGLEAGKRAAQNVSLNQQVRGNNVRRLAGAR